MGIPEIPSASEAMDIAADLASRLTADDTPPPPDSSSSATGTTERSSAAADAAPLPDPVGELRFQVSLDDAVIGAFAECSGLTVEYDVFEYQEGGESALRPQVPRRAQVPEPRAQARRHLRGRAAQVVLRPRTTATSAATSP